jgi:predicted NBD/HSP70 family sugar kinase
MVERAQSLDPSLTSIEDVITRADAGDLQMQSVLADGGAALGRAIAIMLNLLSPSLIVIGGRAVASKIYLEQARATARAESLDQPYRTVQIVSSDAPAASSGARGAATLMLNELFSPSVRNSSLRPSARHRWEARNHAAVKGEVTR